MGVSRGCRRVSRSPTPVSRDASSRRTACHTARRRFLPPRPAGTGRRRTRARRCLASFASFVLANTRGAKLRAAWLPLTFAPSRVCLSSSSRNRRSAALLAAAASGALGVGAGRYRPLVHFSVICSASARIVGLHEFQHASVGRHRGAVRVVVRSPCRSGCADRRARALNCAIACCRSARTCSRCPATLGCADMIT